jgi:hypothetical protein
MIVGMIVGMMIPPPRSIPPHTIPCLRRESVEHEVAFDHESHPYREPKIAHL